MNNLPAFDEVHVVSDLHMGGKAGFQILRETGRLANFILRLAGQRHRRRLLAGFFAPRRATPGGRDERLQRHAADARVVGVVHHAKPRRRRVRRSRPTVAAGPHPGTRP